MALPCQRLTWARPTPVAADVHLCNEPGQRSPRNHPNHQTWFGTFGLNAVQTLLTLNLFEGWRWNCKHARNGPKSPFLYGCNKNVTIIKSNTDGDDYLSLRVVEVRVKIHFWAIGWTLTINVRIFGRVRSADAAHLLPGPRGRKMGGCGAPRPGTARFWGALSSSRPGWSQRAADTWTSNALRQFPRFRQVLVKSSSHKWARVQPTSCKTFKLK